jgi:hypothetical protein
VAALFHRLRIFYVLIVVVGHSTVVDHNTADHTHYRNLDRSKVVAGNILEADTLGTVDIEDRNPVLEGDMADSEDRLGDLNFVQDHVDFGKSRHHMVVAEELRLSHLDVPIEVSCLLIVRSHRTISHR